MEGSQIDSSTLTDPPTNSCEPKVSNGSICVQQEPPTHQESPSYPLPPQSNPLAPPPYPLPLLSYPLTRVRAIITAFKGKVITKSSNPIGYDNMMQLLANHPTWGQRRNDIESIRIIQSKTKTGLIMQLKTTTSKRYFTTSWRKCATKRERRNKIVPDENNDITTNPSTINDDKGMDKEKKDKQNETRKKLIGAMRNAIRYQISAFRRSNHTRHCTQCQSLLHLHVDHVTPFCELFEKFVSKCAQLPIEFDYNRRCQPKIKAVDVKFRRAWQKFHMQHAQLQYLCKACNLKKGKK